MSFRAPNLDDRTFEQLLEEARTRIPQYTPEWTNFNDSDPGMALVQLHAWLTETILYRLNQVPDLNYIKFLDLLHITPMPAVPARAELTFRLRKLDQPQDPLLVLIPKGTRVAVDDPDLEQELTFESDRTLRAVNASLAAIIVPVPDDETTGGNSHLLATTFDSELREATVPNPFYPFGSPPSASTPTSYLLLGLLLRPHQRDDRDYSLDRFPSGALDLAFLVPDVFEKDAEREVILGPNSMHCLFPWQVSERGATITWEAYIGTQHREHFDEDAHWQELVADDHTAGLTRSGHIFLEVPGNLSSAGFADLAAESDAWQGLGLSKPPGTRQELIDAVEENVFDPKALDTTMWEALGIDDPAVCDADDLVDQLSDQSTTLNFDAITTDDWVDAGFDPPPVPFRLTWFRARLIQEPERVPEVSQVLLNTVGATAAVTITDEVVGTSDGRPSQRFQLRRRPVVVDERTREPDLRIEVRTFGETTEWRIVDDFFGTGPGDPVVAFEPQDATLTFGDGVFGRIPVAGAEIIARQYRSGGGEIGNAGPNTITNARGAVFEVDSVTNHRAAVGGSNAETLDAVKLRAPHDLRTRDRAVTAEDFTELAMRTPGVRVHTAIALPRTRVDAAGELESPFPGTVTVVVLPESNDDTPQPTEDQLRLVCAHLNDHRLITTELYVIGPRYTRIQHLRAEVTVDRHADLKAVRDAAATHLVDYFHPIRGGQDRRGWPIGQDIFFGNVYREILGLPGVVRVLCLEIEPEETSASDCIDVVEIPDGTLVDLPRSAIDIEVRYDALG